MEAVPKLPLISFELKVSQEHTHFGPKLKQYISEAYREDPDSYGNEIYQLEQLRALAVRPTIDSSGLSTLIRYFCQLRSMQSRFPMAKGQPAACTFSWKDIYANMSCSLPDIRFEMACILYNIGALHTQLAASEPRTTPDSLKAACTHYQNAAWAFQYLREHYPQPPGVDVATDIMKMMQEICFAQAQECILDKSIQDTRKPSVVGAVATQVQFFYRNSLALLGPSTGNDNIHEIIGTKLYNYWHRYLSFKAFYIGCIVSLYQGLHAEEQQKMGDRVAFYQQAVARLGDARKLAKYIEPVQITQEALTFTNDVVEGKRKAAKNENEFIYHEEVPDKDTLVDFKPVCLVKPLPINFNDPDLTGADIFSRLVPIGAHEASSVYSEEKAKLLRKVVGKAETKTNELSEFMSSLQLDQLEVLDVDQKIPQEIVDRCAAMNAKSDIIQTLVDSMNNLAEIISDVEHSLLEIKTLIHDETLKEKDFQKMMGPRPPSIVQTELSREYHKYNDAHLRTNESNQVLHKAMTLHIANLKLLAQPLETLQSKIPSIDNIEGLDRETMREMRRVVGKAREMQAQRDSLIQQLRDDVTSDDITSQLLARSSEPAEEIFKQELDKHTPKMKIIEQNLAAQENILNKLTSLYAAYGESRRLLSDVLRKREGIINALITSYDTYEELLGKSQKGLEFYKKLSTNVNQLLSRLRSTCQVQEEERDQLMAKQQNNKAPTQTSTPDRIASPDLKLPNVPTVLPPPSSGGTLKLKDCLPYMKNRQARSITPQAAMEPISTDSYYPESIYPSSVRPAPLGSEATDPMKLHDGVMPNPYARYGSTYAPNDTEPYAIPNNYAYPATSKAFDKPDDAYGYNVYSQPQYSQLNDAQYQNPYYSMTKNNPTGVTDSHNLPYGTATQSLPSSTMTNPYNYVDPYGGLNQMAAPEISSANYANPTQDLNTNFAQMHVTPKTEVGYKDYAYNAQYPQTSTPMTYQPNSSTSITNTTYPYQTDNSYQYGQTATTSMQNPYGQNMPNQYDPRYSQYNQDPQFSLTATSDAQTYTIYTSADSSVTSTTSVVNIPVPAPLSAQTYNPYSTDQPQFGNPTLAKLDEMDQPIKSHVTGEALTYTPSYPNYQNLPTPVDQNSAVNYQNPTEQFPPTTSNYQPPNNFNSNTSNVNYAQVYHPGYTFNTSSGNYDYNYGSQNTFSNYGQTVDRHNPDQNWSLPGVYTSAGTYGTVHTPSESPAPIPQMAEQTNNQTYYNVPYGYLTNTNQSNEVPSITTDATNYVANMNQSTYVQSGQQYTSVTYTKNQVSSASLKENVVEPPNFEQNSVASSVQNDRLATDENVEIQSSDKSTSAEVPTAQAVDTQSIETLVPEEPPEPSAFDLLSDIDFSVEQKPLMPEIKVPQISADVMIKKPLPGKQEPVIKQEPVEDIIERPAKIDLFSNPSLVNKFTQEVKTLQTLTDSLTNKTVGGLTVLDSKWKIFQDVQSKENMVRTKSLAKQHSKGNLVTAVVPFDDSRLTLKSDPDAYINASYYKQLAAWCIPLSISKAPEDRKYGTFWKAVVENKITCIVCLLSEIEVQGNTYWPTAKGQSLDLTNVKVTLEEVNCTVHWTERKLTVVVDKTTVTVMHYQITVFPAKIVCSPLVLLADKVLSHTYENRLSNQLTGALIHCSAGAGRSAVMALLIMVMCQVRAGQLNLCEMLDTGCVSLYKHRTNILEDTKYLADAYRTSLFYVQGVLCSGTASFNGEAVTIQSGAGAALPVSPLAVSTNQKTQKFTRESFEEMKQSPGLKSGDMKDPLNFLDPLWSLKKK